MNKKKKFDSSVNFIELERLKEGRFGFLSNEILRENLAIKMQYIIFLVSLEDEYELPGALTYSTFKTIIIYTASIVESLINYKLHQLMDEKRVDGARVMGMEEKYQMIKEAYKISEKEKICVVKKVTKPKKLSERMDFQDLNRAAKRSGLFNDELFKKAEKIRDARNRIHPYSLKEVDDKYTKKDIDLIFAMASDIIKRIERY